MLALLMALAGAASSANAEPDTDQGGTTEVGATLFIDASNRDRGGVQTGDEGIGVDLDRFFINLQHRFDQRWSARMTTDVQWPRQQEPTDLWLRYAYLQGEFGETLTVRIGSAPLPWPGFANQWIGYRYVERELVTRARFGSSADWGVHTEGRFGPDDAFGYALAAVTGSGYKRPRTGDTVDVEARLHWQPSPHAVLGIGTYRGTLAQDAGTAPRLHTARRWTALVAYADDDIRLGAEWFRTEDWNRVAQPAGDAARGWSTWASWQMATTMSLFVRHDRVRPSLSLDPFARGRYSHFGVEWTPDARLRLALVGKHEASEFATGTRSLDELGVWAQVDF